MEPGLCQPLTFNTVAPLEGGIGAKLQGKGGDKGTKSPFLQKLCISLSSFFSFPFPLPKRERARVRGKKRVRKGTVTSKPP